MFIKTTDINSFKPLVKQLMLLKPNSHKGQNGRVLIIGGSSLFHSSSIWAAEIASYFVDIVHYSSTKENNEIFLSLKKKFRNGIVVEQKDLDEYVKEDDAILVGPGMLRKKISNIKNQISKFHIVSKKELNNIKDEGEYTYKLTKYLIETFPNKRFVFDAGALQMMDANWLLKFKIKPILTPHQKEFKQIFKKDIIDLSIEEKIKVVENCAKKYNCVILLKAIVDIISDGEQTYVVEGGNAGLTKGGTGDLLAGLVTSFYAKNNSLISAILASYLLKKTADILYEEKNTWYNIDDLKSRIPFVLREISVV